MPNQSLSPIDLCAYTLPSLDGDEIMDETEQSMKTVSRWELLALHFLYLPLKLIH